MQRSARLVASILALLLSSCDLKTSGAQFTSTASTSGEAVDVSGDTVVTFHRVIDAVPPGQITVINGEKVRAEDWPVLFIAQMSKLVKNKVVNSVCTATLVGPKVLLTAAHCVDAGTINKAVKVRLELPGQTVTAICTMHPDYIAVPPPKENTPRTSSDYALCLLSEDLSTLSNFNSLEYESIDRDTTPSEVKQVLVTGYGCTKIELDPDCKPIFPPIDTVLRAGGGTITAYPSKGDERDYFQTRSVSEAEAALCPGDSGGPLMSGATLKSQTALTRRVVAVNSSIAFPKCNVKDLTSRFSALGAPSFKTWSDDWLKANGNPVLCGANQAAGVFPCRG